MTVSQSETHEGDKQTPPEPPQVGIVDWLRTIALSVAYFFLFVIFDIIQRIAILRGREAHDRTIVQLAHWFHRFLWIVGASVDVTRYGELNPDRPYIIISNHQSYIDIAVLNEVFWEHHVRFVAKKELAYGMPSISFNLRRGGSALVDRSNARQAVKEIERLGEDMSEHCFATVIFPEGTRARRGVLKKFRVTGVATLMQTCPEAAIVPVAIDNTWKFSAYNFMPVPQNLEIKVVVGAPIEPGSHESLKALVAEVHALVEHQLSTVRT